MHLQSHDASIYVAGHRGMVGSAVVRRLQQAGYYNLVLAGRDELDLRDQAAVERFFAAERPRFVVLAAAKVGGIAANAAAPADFLYDNLAIQTHVVRAAHAHGVERLVFLGSSCIYPKHAPQPIREDALLTGPLEPTNEAYAVAKIAGLKLCQAYHAQHGADFVTLMPTNLYGPGDNFDLATSHVLPALLRKFHEGKADPSASVTLWGTGTPRREFLHADDLAGAVLHVLTTPEADLRAAAPDGLLNVGTGEDLEIRALAELVRDVVGSDNPIVYDHSKPDGTPRKRLDVERMRRLGWSAQTPLRDGVAATYAWYRAHEGDARR